MRAIILKSLLFIPLILFVDYILMIFIGCTTWLLGFSSNFYEGSFCNIGKFVLIVSAIVFIAILLPDIKSVMNKKKFS